MSVLQFPDLRSQRGIAPKTDAWQLGKYSTGKPGPTVVLIGGVHGNEPAGVAAIRSVLTQLRERQLPLRGTVCGLLGNPEALKSGQRYLSRDLNRGWHGRTLSALRHGYGSAHEDAAQRGLLAALAPYICEPDPKPVTFIDLHSTSGPGAPFACIADVRRNYTVAAALPMPVILGIEEMLDGTLLGFLCDLGHSGIAIEGGQNDDPATVLRHEAAIWISLVATGALRADEVDHLARHRATLAQATAKLPRFVEVRHRHVTRPQDGFTMEPGLASLEGVRKGHTLARDHHGRIGAVTSGRLLMPRYQAQGDDGFFIVRDVPASLLRFSGLIRKVPTAVFAAFLPGLTRVGADEFTVGTSRRGTRRVLERLGYRRIRATADGSLHLSRRRPDERGVDPFDYDPALR